MKSENFNAYNHICHIAPQDIIYSFDLFKFNSIKFSFCCAVNSLKTPANDKLTKTAFKIQEVFVKLFLYTPHFK